MNYLLGSIEDIYQTVINDVIGQMEEAFVEEGVDINLLTELKKSWETKLMESGAVDLNPPQFNGSLRTRFIKRQDNFEPYFIPNFDEAGPSTQVNRGSLNIPSQARYFIKRNISQLDGGGPGMSDSSSEDEDVLTDNLDTLLENKDDENANEEPPLNSDDDQSDEEDLSTLFDSRNIVICQFEKITRTRNKWTLAFKDGILHINGVDYCFSKCNGLADW